MSKRIQFEFAAAVIDRLEAIKRQTGRQSYAEVVRDGLRLLEWFVAQEAAGYEIGLVKDDVLVKVVKIIF
jgi:hypothetical protein